MDTIGDKISRKVEETNMELVSRTRKDLFIKGLTQQEYTKFINFIKTNTPNRKGYEAIAILLSAFDRVNENSKLVAYIDTLEAKVAELETKPKQEEVEKPKYIGVKNV